LVAPCPITQDQRVRASKNLYQNDTGFGTILE
jgi:hypothetical protein